MRRKPDGYRLVLTDVVCHKPPEKRNDIMSKSKVLLKEMYVVVLDCQATSSNPQSGFLLEIGWLKTSAADLQKAKASAENVEHYLIQKPLGEKIPFHISRITGLKGEDFVHAVAEEIAWKNILRMAAQITKYNRMAFCPTVVHYSRYEEPFLRKLHEGESPNKNFPLVTLCTHRIIKGLFPNLPRKSLRAVAGYFGHPVPELRRSVHHVLATSVIWQHAVELLENKEGVRTRAELMDWLANTRCTSRIHTGRSSKTYPMDSDLRLGLPDAPGVYRMLRSNGDLLYIGKAKSIKRRVNSYFQKSSSHKENILEMLTQARHLDFSLTDTALEAALLESDEIKRFSPPYNSALRQKGRKPTFFSKDLRGCSFKPSEYYSVGPLPTKDSLKSVSLLGKLVLAGTDFLLNQEVCAVALGVPKNFAPGSRLFKNGLEAFRQKHERLLDKYQGKWELTVHTLGKKLWAERRENNSRRQTTDDSENQNTVRNGKVGKDWAPEAVVCSLENVVCQGAHLVRRGRWLCLLSESSLRWECGGTAAGGKILIIFENGNVLLREALLSQKEVPVPPGHARKLFERQKCFDLVTYDRMRVLLSEIKRLVSEGRDICLRLGPDVILHQKNLSRELKWL
jgi:DNA polymerase-3 subunit epsilon